jgi:trigger factor
VKITQEEVVDRQTVLNIELEEDDLDSYIDQGYRKIAPRLAIPGFRKGKAPRRIVEQFVGRESLLNEVLDTMLPEITGKAIEEQSIEAAGMPSIELEELDPIIVKATVPLMPEISLGDYKEISVEEEPANVSEEDVQQRLEQIQHGMASWEPVERTVQMGDLVTIQATGLIDGDSVVDEKDAVIFLDEDSDRPFPGFAQQLADMAQDEVKEFTLPIPEEFGDEKLAGKDVAFSVTVGEIKERVLPELDDEFAKSVGDGYESFEAMKAEIESDANEAAESSATQKYNEAVMEAFLKGVTIEVAPVMVGHEVTHMEGERSRVLSQINVRLDDYLRSIGKSEEEMRDELRSEAEARIKRTYAMSKLAEEEGIEVSEEDVEERITEILANNTQDTEGLPVQPEFTDEMRESVNRVLSSEKTLERLVAIAKGEKSFGAKSKPESVDDTQDGEDGSTEDETSEQSEGE